jgi:hypothetical protein
MQVNNKEKEIIKNIGMILDMFACESPLHENSRGNVMTIL